MRIGLRQLSLASQVKACGAAALFAVPVLWLLFMALQAAGAPLMEPRFSAGVIAITMLVMSLLFVGALFLLQIAGLALLRALRLRGPTLEVEGGEAGLSRLFE